MTRPGDFRFYLTVEVHDPDGRRRFYRRYRGRSLVKNFLLVVFGSWASALHPTGNAVDDTGATRAIGTSSDDQANLVNLEPVIGFGSGTTAPTISDFDAETDIGGVAADFTADNSSGATTSIRYRMTTTNNTGGDWSVNELYVKVNLTWANVSRVFLIARDVLGSTVTVADGQAITITADFETTV